MLQSNISPTIDKENSISEEIDSINNDKMSEKISLGDLSIGDNVYLLRSNASWDHGWTVRAKHASSVVFGKEKLTKKLNLKQLPLYCRPASSPKPRDPSLLQAIDIGDWHILKQAIRAYGDLNKQSSYAPPCERGEPRARRHKADQQSPHEQEPRKSAQLVSDDEDDPFFEAASILADQKRKTEGGDKTGGGVDGNIEKSGGEEAAEKAEISAGVRKIFPLLYAVENAEKAGAALVRLLLIKGADVDVEDEKGRRCLHIAAEKGDVEIVKALLDFGADVSAQCDNGKTALHLAVESNSKSVVLLLIQKGCSTILTDATGKTAQEIAEEAGLDDLANLLKDWGHGQAEDSEENSEDANFLEDSEDVSQPNIDGERCHIEPIESGHEAERDSAESERDSENGSRCSSKKGSSQSSRSKPADESSQDLISFFFLEETPNQPGDDLKKANGPNVEKDKNGNKKEYSPPERKKSAEKSLEIEEKSRKEKKGKKGKNAEKAENELKKNENDEKTLKNTKMSILTRTDQKPRGSAALRPLKDEAAGEKKQRILIGFDDNIFTPNEQDEDGGLAASAFQALENQEFGQSDVRSGLPFYTSTEPDSASVVRASGLMGKEIDPNLYGGRNAFDLEFQKASLVQRQPKRRPRRRKKLGGGFQNDHIARNALAGAIANAAGDAPDSKRGAKAAAGTSMAMASTDRRRVQPKKPRKSDFGGKNVKTFLFRGRARSPNLSEGYSSDSSSSSRERERRARRKKKSGRRRKHGRSRRRDGKHRRHSRSRHKSHRSRDKKKRARRTSSSSYSYSSSPSSSSSPERRRKTGDFAYRGDHSMSRRLHATPRDYKDLRSPKDAEFERRGFGDDPRTRFSVQRDADLCGFGNSQEAGFGGGYHGSLGAGYRGDRRVEHLGGAMERNGYWGGGERRYTNRVGFHGDGPFENRYGSSPQRRPMEMMGYREDGPENPHLRKGGPNLYVASGFASSRQGSNRRIVGSKYNLSMTKPELSQPPNLVRERVERNSDMEKIKKQIESLKITQDEIDLLDGAFETPGAILDYGRGDIQNDNKSKENRAARDSSCSDSEEKDASEQIKRLPSPIDIGAEPDADDVVDEEDSDSIHWKTGSEEAEAFSDENVKDGREKVGKEEEEESKNEVLETGDECCICLEAKKNTLFLPCKHVCCCKGCSTMQDACPICDSKVEEKFDIAS